MVNNGILTQDQEPGTKLNCMLLCSTDCCHIDSFYWTFLETNGLSQEWIHWLLQWVVGHLSDEALGQVWFQLLIIASSPYNKGLLRWLSGKKKKKKKNPPANAGDARHTGSIPGSGRSLGEGNNNPLQYLARKSHGHRSLVGLQSMGSQRVGNDYSYTAIPLTWVFLRFSFMGTRDQNKSKGERTHQSLHVTWRPWP